MDRTAVARAYLSGRVMDLADTFQRRGLLPRYDLPTSALANPSESSRKKSMAVADARVNIRRGLWSIHVTRGLASFCKQLAVPDRPSGHHRCWTRPLNLKRISSERDPGHLDWPRHADLSIKALPLAGQ